MLRDRSHLDDVLTTMAQAGIDDAFVIGGDTTPPVGPYASAVDLLPLVHEHPHRPRSIGIASIPQGAPFSNRLQRRPHGAAQGNKELPAFRTMDGFLQVQRPGPASPLLVDGEARSGVGL